MTFYDFIIDFVNDDTPLGQLAHFINRDKHFPKHATSYHEIYAYFKMNYTYNEVMTSAKRALSLYHNNLDVN
ncbi:MULTISPECIES: sterile alpha motif-like domain-containing protein [Staphylococcus]|jgi:uncharacterized protein YozE (UPF0346 family)|uniref:Cytosolic protein n=1 Tax=Staphylococcus nepalensis TaxID=214473 RepID=A0A291JMC9_9STAP|nr:MULTISPECIES: sterile alpha motif-like domain-containing protein [Staphylococcus]VDG67705.1 Protein of uncharacterised function (DUF1250) [Lacrimispora indolis]ATH60730.1 hypothetical protein BJD96_10675 [Staphylococcus nepalensis]ATH65777.1 hypothetical protein BJG89_10775 [Staphylococcus nepalensis]AWI45153.1 hypothetical protein BJG88_10570 [Staphylococcus nepalensis]MBO1206689.1 sterile alpha motif-like domain-containing protein [Staphylococcus nepalensis]